MHSRFSHDSKVCFCLNMQYIMKEQPVNVRSLRGSTGRALAFLQTISDQSSDDLCDQRFESRTRHIFFMFLSRILKENRLLLSPFPSVRPSVRPQRVFFAYKSWTDDWIMMKLAHIIDINKMFKIHERQRNRWWAELVRALSNTGGRRLSGQRVHWTCHNQFWGQLLNTAHFSWYNKPPYVEFTFVYTSAVTLSYRWTRWL